MFCRKCGQRIDAEASFCPNCGTQCNKPAPKDSQSSSKKNLKRRVWWIWGIGIICGLVLIAVLIVLKQSFGLGKQEAQQQLNAVLEDVYQESSSDNFIMEALDGNVTVRVDRVYFKNGNYIASCTVSSPDVATAIRDYVESLSRDEIASYTDVVKELTDEINTTSTIMETFEVRFVKSQDDWHPIVPEKMVAFCCGNVHELLPLIYGILEGGES